MEALRVAHQEALEGIIEEIGHPNSSTQKQLMEEAREALKNLVP